MVLQHSAAYLALSVLVLFASAQSEGEQCLLQRSRSKVHAHVDSAVLQDKGNSSMEIDLLKVDSLAWSTNIGQEFHKCEGSHFKVDYSGTNGGMVVTKGMLLRKGLCPDKPNGTVPKFTQSLTCEAKATGCHMWCSPVWQSHHDSLDWGAFDARCRGWDGSFHNEDTDCATMGRVFTWARVDVPASKNQLDLTFAISDTCTHWCSPLWVTIYDPKNWAKSYRWCINKKDEWGGCDNAEEVPMSSWHDRSYPFHLFMQKHGYVAENFVLELAVYAEFESPEIMINSIKLKHVKEATTTPAPVNKLVTMTCGSEPSCGENHQCCRRGDSEVDAKCCPKDWSCCEDSCCPSFYTCNITEFGHTCKPPVGEVYEKPAICAL